MNLEQLTLCNRYKCDLIPKNNNSLSGFFDQVMENLVLIFFYLELFQLSNFTVFPGGKMI